ncbi:siderophore-interacting protein [Acinetobacter gerneri]|uniref:siderophore-interacting protein n=1 Tax=Acinetobacter gerneri TaxID=202952 RepID=UPI0023F4EFE4|nr:siderophore-interacting protein [Acinetobacter gerneri]
MNTVTSKQNSKSFTDKNSARHDMQQIEMSIVSITQPFPSISRITGKIDTSQTELWALPNVALRLLFANSENNLPISRVYTVRAFDAEKSEIEIDLVKHADLSPAMQWLNTVQVGDNIKIIGPRPHFAPDFSLDKHVVMFADDTAIPALYSILQHWQKGISADLYIESFEENIIQQLPLSDQIRIHFLHKTDHHQTGWLFASALQIDDCTNKTIWAACERSEARALRELFLEEHKMDKNLVKISGYWKAGVSSSDLDKVRAKHYLQHTQQGKTLAEYDDLDMPNEIENDISKDSL